jgi:integrase
MAWSEVDFDSAQWVIPAERTKTGVEHIVHLSEPALAIASDLRVKQSNDTDLIFTTTGKTPISGFSKSKRELDQLSGVDNWKIHDFRRTAVSHMADIGIDPTVADRVLNHAAAGSMSTVQRVYQRSSMLEQRRRALNAWADFVLACTQNKDQFQGNG